MLACSYVYATSPEPVGWEPEECEAEAEPRVERVGDRNVHEEEAGDRHVQGGRYGVSPSAVRPWKVWPAHAEDEESYDGEDVEEERGQSREVPQITVGSRE